MPAGPTLSGSSLKEVNENSDGNVFKKQFAFVFIQINIKCDRLRKRLGHHDERAARPGTTS
jgi:hypothetical protein